MEKKQTNKKIWTWKTKIDWINERLHSSRQHVFVDDYFESISFSLRRKNQIVWPEQVLSSDDELLFLDDCKSITNWSEVFHHRLLIEISVRDSIENDRVTIHWHKVDHPHNHIERDFSPKDLKNLLDNVHANAVTKCDRSEIIERRESIDAIKVNAQD